MNFSSLVDMGCIHGLECIGKALPENIFLELEAISFTYMFKYRLFFLYNILNTIIDVYFID